MWNIYFFAKNLIYFRYHFDQKNYEQHKTHNIIIQTGEVASGTFESIVTLISKTSDLYGPRMCIEVTCELLPQQLMF